MFEQSVYCFNKSEFSVQSVAKSRDVYVNVTNFQANKSWCKGSHLMFTFCEAQLFRSYSSDNKHRQPVSFKFVYKKWNLLLKLCLIANLLSICRLHMSAPTIDITTNKVRNHDLASLTNQEPIPTVLWFQSCKNRLMV